MEQNINMEKKHMKDTGKMIKKVDMEDFTVSMVINFLKAN
jgi:hypothetical protein